MKAHQIAFALAQAKLNHKADNRDEIAKREHRAVKCKCCHKLYYPGDPLDRLRPRTTNGRFIPCSSVKNYCSHNCSKGVKNAV
jgi:hypothetical protein